VIEKRLEKVAKGWKMLEEVSGCKKLKQGNETFCNFK